MILIKTKEEIEIMAEGGKILAKIMKELEKRIKPGIATKELNELSEELILKSGGKCSFKGYGGYPACLCVSLNEQVVHGVPSDRILKEGDIVSLDLGIFYNGFHADMANTLPVGRISSEALRLIRTTKESFKKGLEEIKPGNTFGDIGNAVQELAESQGYGIIRDLCGHGIGRKLHEDPQILNYGKKKTGPEIKEGMVFCIEPMLSAGNWEIKKSPDNYAFQTADSSLSCHFEHTIAVTENGYKILTEI